MNKEKDKAELVVLYRAGTPVTALCKKFGVCKSTAYNWIQKYTPIKRKCRRTVTPEDVYRLEREIQTLRTENEIIHRSGLLQKVPLEDKIAAIDQMQSDYSVYILCNSLGVLRSTYYHHKLPAPERKWYELNDDIIRPIVKEIFFESRERFGARKIRHVLNKKHGYKVSEAHVRRLMKEMGLVCKQVRLRYYSTTNRKYKYYRNKIQRKFHSDAPNLVWVSDFSCVYVKDVLCYIAVIIDLYARVVVAAEVTEKTSAELMIRLFDSAYEKRNRPNHLTFHSDQGSEYTAYIFRKHLRDLGVNQSFSNPGKRLDNAVMESFYSCLKREELSHNYYDTIEDLRRDVLDFVDYFNNMRPHQRLGMMTPCEAEQKFNDDKK